MLSLFYLILVIIIICCLLFFTNKLKSKINITDIENSRYDFLIYLDKFFVVNIWVTLFNVSLYTLLNIIIILFVRLYFVKFILDTEGELFNVEKTVLYEENLFNFSQIIFKFVLLIIIILLLKLLLDKIFFTSLIKLHLYFKTKKFYQKILSKLRPYYLVEFFGKCYLFLYNIVKGQTLRDLTDATTYNEIDDYDYIYQSDMVKKISDKWIYYAQKCIIIFLITLLLRNTVKWFYFHLRLTGLISYMPKIIFLFLILYDLTHFKIYYTVHVFYLYYMLTVFINYLLFLHNKHGLHEHELSIYFYNNKINYQTQRVLLKKDLSLFINLLMQDKHNQYILKNIQNLSLIVYIINDFKEKWDDKTQKTTQYLNSLYKRYYILILFLFVTTYLYKNQKYYIILVKYDLKISAVFVLIFLLCIIMFFSKKTYISENLQDIDYFYLADYKHNKLFNFLFWIITIISMSIIYLLMLKSKLLLTDILFDSSNLKIIKYYTLEEKLTLFYSIFDLYIKTLSIHESHLNQLTSLLQELHIDYFIFENTTIEEINNLIKNYVSYYVTEVNNLTTPKENKVMTHIKNFIITLVLLILKDEFLLTIKNKWMIDIVKKDYLSLIILFKRLIIK